MIPPRILDHGSVRIAWHEATLTREAIIEDLPPLPPEIYPVGTKGWFRRTSRHRGTFLPEGSDAGVQIHVNDLEVSPRHVEIEYEISDEQPAAKPTKPKTPWRYHA